jgi:hypothetical protein
MVFVIDLLPVPVGCLENSNKWEKRLDPEFSAREYTLNDRRSE